MSINILKKSLVIGIKSGILIHFNQRIQHNFDKASVIHADASWDFHYRYNL
jgi:hypothetical protein